jgi:hypothetical protein
MTETGCAYPEGEDPPFEYCGARTVAGSPYCPEHHLLCYLPSGSRRERAAIRHINRLAELAGQRREPRPGMPLPQPGAEPAAEQHW